MLKSGFQGGISGADPARLHRNAARAEGGGGVLGLPVQIIYAFLNDQQMSAARWFYRNTVRPPTFSISKHTHTKKRFLINEI